MHNVPHSYQFQHESQTKAIETLQAEVKNRDRYIYWQEEEEELQLLRRRLESFQQQLQDSSQHIHGLQRELDVAYKRIDRLRGHYRSLQVRVSELSEELTGRIERPDASHCDVPQLVAREEDQCEANGDELTVLRK